MGVVRCLADAPPTSWPAPLCCFPKALPNSTFLWRIKYGCLQYVYTVPILAMVTLGCHFFDVYAEGSLSYKAGYFWISLFWNNAQLWALYVLAWLYLVLRADLAPFNPVMKFLVVKAVVFLSFWQEVGLAILSKIGGLPSMGEFNSHQVAIFIQDFLICIEMFLAALVHQKTFGYSTYQDREFLDKLVENELKGLDTQGRGGEDCLIADHIVSSENADAVRAQDSVEAIAPRHLARAASLPKNVVVEMVQEQEAHEPL